MSARLSDYDYDLPDELIAARPLPGRDESRMMVLRRDSQSIEHRMFRDLPTFVEPGDLFLLNNTRVLGARKFSDDGKIEFLFLERLGSNRWKCLVKPGRRMRVGATTAIDNVPARVEEITPEGERIVALERDVDLYASGSMPLPPYIGRASDVEDESRYQTVFAQEPGAIAAPTAGLHFTPEILSKIPHAFITLHVGQGTFLPVKSENIVEHKMHSEKFAIPPSAVNQINRAKRLIAVGTTTVRVLESVVRQTYPLLKAVNKDSSSRKDRLLKAVNEDSSPRKDRLLKAVNKDSSLRKDRLLKAVDNGKKAEIEAQSGETDIFIYPPFEFRLVDSLLTNFHLPRSTLLMLVSAFAGREFILKAYAEAIRQRYRFFSYGDCMLIL